MRSEVPMTMRITIFWGIIDPEDERSIAFRNIVIHP
jgi:hypothetical protein